MCQVCEELKAEKAAVRPIPVDEILTNENVFAERVWEKTQELWTKYNCILQPTLVFSDGVTEEEKKIFKKNVKGIMVELKLNNHVFVGERAEEA